MRVGSGDIKNQVRNPGCMRGCDGWQGMTTATRHHKRQGNGYGHPNTMRVMRKTAIVSIILAATSLTTANLLTCLKENTTRVLASWNGTWFESMDLTCRSTLYHKMKEALKTIREEKRLTPMLARCWRRFIRRREKIQGMCSRLRKV